MIRTLRKRYILCRNTCDIDKNTIQNQFSVRVIKITSDYLIIRSNHKRLTTLISELEAYGYETITVSGTLKALERKNTYNLDVS